MKDADLFFRPIIIDADGNQLKKKKVYQTSKSDAQKRANLLKKIFNSIYITCCRKLFALAWYRDMTYVESKRTAQNEYFCEFLSRKALPKFCCNGPSCKSQKPDYILRETFINRTLSKHIKVEQE